MPTLIPAYGRDYTSAKAAKADYLAGKDFILNDIMSCYHGKPCSARDFLGQMVNIRYHKLARVFSFRTPDELTN